jgi:hypothetical protein
MPIAFGSFVGINRNRIAGLLLILRRLLRLEVFSSTLARSQWGKGSLSQL